MKMKKTIIKKRLFDMYLDDLLKYEDLNRYWNSVKFLSERSTDIWYNALIDLRG